MTRHLKRNVTRTILSALTLFALVTICSATTFITPSDDTLIIESRGIVRGRVLSTGAAYDEATGFVFTYVKIKVKEVFKGNISSSIIVLKEVGGQAGAHGTLIFSRPQFTQGEQVLLYLDTWPDGSLRVRDQFLGKYSISKDAATGEFMVERFGPEGERNVIPMSPGGQTTNSMEYHAYLNMLRQHLTANALQSANFEQTYFPSAPIYMEPSEYLGKLSRGLVEPSFHIFNPPARWFQPDSSQAVTYVINTTGQPSANAVADVDAAMRAWSTVSGCALRIVDGGTTSACSSLVANEGLVDFNNCRGFFSSSGGTCQGILAEGGANFTSGATTVVSGTTFDEITSSFVSFNPFAACSFSSDCNVQEITTHEMGHSVGMQHSWDPSFGGSPTAVQQQATMYYIAHFDGRCASVMSDDIAGITFVYPGSSTPTPNYVGFIDVANCTSIGGWAADRNRLNTSINVQIYDGTSLVAIVPAFRPRPDVATFLGDNGLHGLTIPIPAALQNGASHTVHVKFENSSTELSGSPFTLSCGAITPSYIGFVDVGGCNSIGGWAADTHRLNQPISVSIYDGSTLLITLRAGQV
ncbi:MAG TPA: hypothetical protein VEZ90_05660, partial [Blastocatellia bacterium]|nr:hypothetical protein [Blastocatellia bacterium]